MAYEIELTLRVLVSNDEEAEKLIEATYSGLAADVLRLGVLYGQVSAVGGASGGAPQPGGQISERKRQEAEVELQDVQTLQGHRPVVAQEPEEHSQQPRHRSIAGMRRMGRQ